MQRINDGARVALGQAHGWNGSLRRGAWRVLALLVLAGICAPDGWAGPRRRNELSAAGAGTPQLVIDRGDVDLGDLPKGSSSVARFELRNTGTADLRILDVQTACGCTVATFDELIPPGGVGTVTATLSTDALEGEVSKSVTLVTNDPTATTAQLWIRAAVVSAVRILPEVPIVLRNDDRSDTVRRLVRRRADSGHGFFNIAGLRSSEPWLEARARKVREAEAATDDLPAARVGDWVLQLRLKGQPPYRSSHQEVRFSTGLDRQPQVWIPVLAEIAAPVRFQVDRLLLPDRAGSASDTLEFSVREGLDPSELRIEARPEGLEVEHRPGPGRASEAQVIWRGGPLEDGKLIFRIGDEVYELPVALASAG